MNLTRCAHRRRRFACFRGELLDGLGTALALRRPHLDQLARDVGPRVMLTALFGIVAERVRPLEFGPPLSLQLFPLLTCDNAGTPEDALFVVVVELRLQCGVAGELPPRHRTMAGLGPERHRLGPVLLPRGPQLVPISEKRSEIVVRA